MGWKTLWAQQIQVKVLCVLDKREAFLNNLLTLSLKLKFIYMHNSLHLPYQIVLCQTDKTDQSF